MLWRLASSVRLLTQSNLGTGSTWFTYLVVSHPVTPARQSSQKMAVTVDRESALWKELYAKNEGSPNAEKLTDSVYRYKVLNDKILKERHSIKAYEKPKGSKKNLK